jgi:hypothetical protein
MALQTINGPVIAAGTALSDSVDCSAVDRIIRIIMPSTWNGAALSFQLSSDGVNFSNLYHVDNSTFFGYEVVVPRPVPGACITLPPGMSLAMNFLKIRSGTSSLPVGQQSDCTFTLVGEATVSSKAA